MLIAEIIKKHPHLKNHEEFLKTVIEIRKAFNCKDNFKITIGTKVIGKVDIKKRKKETMDTNKPIYKKTRSRSPYRRM